MNGQINQNNLRAKVKKAVTPDFRLADIAKATKIQAATLSRFLKWGMDIKDEDAKKIYDFLKERKLQEVS